jgi:hypothetical protein
VLSRDELILLFEVAFAATLCNIAFNGRGGCCGGIKPERERNRTNLERMFMAARDRFYATPGYQALDPAYKASICKSFLTVAVANKNLAG